MLFEVLCRYLGFVLCRFSCNRLCKIIAHKKALPYFDRPTTSACKMYRDVASPEKTARTEDILKNAVRMFGKHTFRCVLLDGEEMRTSTRFVQAGIPAGNITIVERDYDTHQEHVKRCNQDRSLSFVNLFHGTVADYIEALTSETLPEVFYLDYTGSWLGSNEECPLDDIWRLLEMAYVARRDKVLLAVTFSSRTNYRQQGGGFGYDARRLISRRFERIHRMPKGRLRNLKRKAFRDSDAVLDYLRDKIFPFSGYGVTRYNSRNDEAGMKYSRTGSPMIYIRSNLFRLVHPRRNIRFPVIKEYGMIGFEQTAHRGDWEMMDVRDTKHQ